MDNIYNKTSGQASYMNPEVQTGEDILPTATKSAWYSYQYGTKQGI